jgi:hypothetical protein
MLKNPACSRSVAFRFRGFGVKGGLRGEFGGRRGFGGRGGFRGRRGTKIGKVRVYISISS